VGCGGAVGAPPFPGRRRLEVTGRRGGIRVKPALYIMIAPAVVLTLIYHYGPLFGLSIAFQQFDIARSIFRQRWVGFDNFVYVFHYPYFFRVLWNTFYIAGMKYLTGLLIPIVVALMINEVGALRPKRAIQTAVYLPHFISWVILSGLFADLLSPSTGAINGLLKLVGIKPIYFLAEPTLFPLVMVVTDVWKNFGFGTIIYLAALTGIDPNLYEAAEIDGARRLRMVLHISIPGIVHIVVLVAILNLGGILNAGFEQIFNLYNPMVYSTGDILDTLVYRMGIQDVQYDLATTIGLFKSAISLVLVSGSYYVAYRTAGYRIF
jgi:putative aldouronate transport system permease protein